MLSNNNNDAHYRYKLDTVESVNIKGNFTCIKNFKKIGSDLNMDPFYISQFFKIELGANSRKENDGGISYCGNFTNVRLNEVLNKFSKLFCICSVCKVPELLHEVKGGKLLTKCKACGKANVIVAKHKLLDFFIKNGGKVKVNLK